MSQYHCDVCGQDCLNRVRILCAECPEYDLCVPCFSTGASSGDHKPYHAYRVIEQPVFPIFDEDWGADEERLLIEGAQSCGLGNWVDIAKHIGGRSKEEVQKHYFDYYLNSPSYPIPDMDKDFSHVLPEEFAQKRKARLEERLRAPIPPPLPKPPALVPLCHEINGYMPGRLEFEVEYENDAEHTVKEMVFDPTDTPQDVETKLTILEIYDSRLSARAERKRLMLRYHLMDYRKHMEAEKRRKRSKEEKELHTKIKAFSRLMAPEDFQAFSEDIEAEFSIRNRIMQLQTWRMKGLTSIEAGMRYERERAARGITLQRGAATRHGRSVLSAADRYLGDLIGGNGYTPHSTSNYGNGTYSKVKKNGGLPLDISGAPDIELLLPEEQKLCSGLRIRPKPYLAIKETIFRELNKLGGVLSKKAARELVNIESTKILRIYDFFAQQKWISQA